MINIPASKKDNANIIPAGMTEANLKIHCCACKNLKLKSARMTVKR
jgi:hypothetical protein